MASPPCATTTHRTRGRRVAANLAWIVGGGFLLVVAAIAIPQIAQPWQDGIDFAIVASLAGLVAYGELVSRYRDSPARLFAARPTPIYILVNIAAGVIAFAIVRHTGVLGDSHPARFNQILLGAFGAIAFFRTSLFTARIGGNDVGIGPSALLKSLLDATDRMIDRDQAEGRAGEVAGIMRGVDFATARVALPTLCFTLVETIDSAAQEGARQQIDKLASSREIDDQMKSVILGTYMIRLVGADVLVLAIEALRPKISAGASGP